MGEIIMAVAIPEMGAVVILAAFGVGLFWVFQFAQLMMLEDSLFRGRFDKVIWGGAFIFTAPLAPFAFLAWKAARAAERSSQSDKQSPSQ